MNGAYISARGGGGVNKSFRKYAKQFCIKTKK